MTKVHNAGWLKTGKAVPDGAVNLACYSAKKPNVLENVQVTSMMDKSFQPIISLMRQGNGNLHVPISSRLFLITDKIEEESGEALFYIYTLKYKTRIPEEKKQIQIISNKGYVPDTYKFRQEFIPEENGLYSVRIYTNFWADKVASFYAIYNGIDENGKLLAGVKEFINPHPYMNLTESFLEWNTYKIEEKDRLFQITVGGYSPVYYLKPLDNGNLTGKNAIDVKSNWYPRVINGYIEQFNPDTKMPEKITYTIPDYYSQNFFNNTAPYMQVTEEAAVINQSAIKVRNTPIYAPVVDGEVTNIKVTLKSAFSSGDKEIKVTSVDSNLGTIYLLGLINPNDRIEVTYCYSEDAFIYKGYTDENSGEWVPLDVNPSNGHEYGEIEEDGSISIKPAFGLLNKTIYIYARPSLLLINPVNVNDEQHDIPESLGVGVNFNVKLNYTAKRNAKFVVRTKYSGVVLPRSTSIQNVCTWDFVNGEYEAIDSIVIRNAYKLCGEPILIDYLTEDNYQVIKERKSNTLFHTTKPLSIAEQDEERAMLVTKLYVRPNSLREDVKLIDTRTRGGGFIEMDDEIRKIINPESEYFLDISHINGSPMQKNAVIIVNVNKKILKENGGIFERNDVEAAVSKHVAFGVLPVIQYVEPTEHNVLE